MGRTVNIFKRFWLKPTHNEATMYLHNLPFAYVTVGHDNNGVAVRKQAPIGVALYNDLIRIKCDPTSTYYDPYHITTYRAAHEWVRTYAWLDADHKLRGIRV